MRVVQPADRVHSKGQREGRLRLAAAQIQHIIAGEGLMLFSALLFLCRAHGGEQQAAVIQPQEAAFLSKAGQGADFAVIEIQAAFIAVFLLVGVGYHKGSLLAVWRMLDGGKKTVLQKILQLKFVHVRFSFRSKRK